MQTSRLSILFRAWLPVLVLACIACNNPFDTRDPEKPGAGGVAIKPANTPENVLSNLESSFESLSIQDYLDVFAGEFSFHPDPEDSLLYEQDFKNGWDLAQETVFANNFLIRHNFADVEGNPVEVNASYEYEAGFDLYEYHYQMFVPLRDASGGPAQTIEIEGYAFIRFLEDDQGNWSILDWEDHRLTADSLTWGALRARHI